MGNLIGFLQARLGEDDATAGAERALLDLHAPDGYVPDDCGACARPEPGREHGIPSPCRTLRLLAAPYADHPAYQPEWAPRA